jgi:hypothetical protein
MPDEVPGGYAVLLQDLRDPASGLVLAKNADGNRISAQGLQIEERVTASSKRKFPSLVGENEHRSFSGDASGCPIEILIEDEVSPYDDLFLGEIIDNLEQGPLFFIHGTCQDFARKAVKNQSTLKKGTRYIFPEVTKIGTRYIFPGVKQKGTRYHFLW